MSKKILNVRISENEELALAQYAAAMQRSKTEIVREFLRSLAREAKAKPRRATANKSRGASSSA